MENTVDSSITIPNVGQFQLAGSHYSGMADLQGMPVRVVIESDWKCPSMEQWAAAIAHAAATYPRLQQVDLHALAAEVAGRVLTDLYGAAAPASAPEAQAALVHDMELTEVALLPGAVSLAWRSAEVGKGEVYAQLNMDFEVEDVGIAEL